MSCILKSIREHTQHAGRVKAFNAECERRLTASEALLAVVCADGGEVPRDALDSLWKQILFLQFHDILPRLRDLPRLY